MEFKTSKYEINFNREVLTNIVNNARSAFLIKRGSEDNLSIHNPSIIDDVSSLLELTSDDKLASYEAYLKVIMNELSVDDIASISAHKYYVLHGSFDKTTLLNAIEQIIKKGTYTSFDEVTNNTVDRIKKYCPAREEIYVDLNKGYDYEGLLQLSKVIDNEIGVKIIKNKEKVTK